MDDPMVAIDIAIGFICFSLTASVVYIINDLKDIEEDRLHPEKKHRPFAAGSAKTGSGIILAILLLVISMVVAYWLRPEFLIILAVYFLINLAYSLKLKHVPLLDISIIAIGFVLRVVAGGAIPDIYVSHWILIMTFLLALFLGFAKRRDDVKIFRESGKKMRKSNIKALVSLILGLAFWIPLINLIFGTIAVIIGTKAIIEINRNPDLYSGLWLAVFGIILGAVPILFFILGFGMCLYGYVDICKSMGLSFLA